MEKILNEELKKITGCEFIKDAIDQIIPKTDCILGISGADGKFTLYNLNLGLIIYRTGVVYRDIHSIEAALIEINNKFLKNNPNRVTEDYIFNQYNRWKKVADKYIYD